MDKKWYTSKTLWVNALVIAAGLFTGLADQLGAGNSVGIVGVLNLLLRAVTKTGLK